MANKLNVKGIAIASAAVTAVLYAICFIIVLAFGDASLQFFQLFFHGVDITGLGTTPNIGAGILGLIISAVAAYITGAVFALIYNKFAK